MTVSAGRHHMGLVRSLKNSMNMSVTKEGAEPEREVQTLMDILRCVCVCVLYYKMLLNVPT